MYWLLILAASHPLKQVKFIYDHVFEPHTDNRSVYKTVASPIVQSALDGINGTVFACALSVDWLLACKVLLLPLPLLCYRWICQGHGGLGGINGTVFGSAC